MVAQLLHQSIDLGGRLTNSHHIVEREIIYLVAIGHAVNGIGVLRNSSENPFHSAHIIGWQRYTEFTFVQEFDFEQLPVELILAIQLAHSVFGENNDSVYAYLLGFVILLQFVLKGIALLVPNDIELLVPFWN